jgi:hypothetical protein
MKIHFQLETVLLVVVSGHFELHKLLDKITVILLHGIALEHVLLQS